MVEMERVYKVLHKIKTGEDKDDVSVDDVVPSLARAQTASEVRDLIAGGADVHERHWWGDGTMLFYRSNDEVVVALVEAGCDVGEVNEMERTALHEASGSAVKALIECGADVQARDIGGLTPLHISRDEEGMRHLLLMGADINAQDGNGWTPLHKCIDDFADNVDEKDIASAHRLLGHGADVTLRDKNGRTPIDLANEIMKECPDLDELADLARAMQAKADREALNTDDTLDRIKASKPATPKKRGPL